MNLRFLRDTDKRKVDFVVIKDNSPLFAVECKSGEKNVNSSLFFRRSRPGSGRWGSSDRGLHGPAGQDPDCQDFHRPAVLAESGQIWLFYDIERRREYRQWEHRHCMPAGTWRRVAQPPNSRCCQRRPALCLIWSHRPGPQTSPPW